MRVRERDVPQGDGLRRSDRVRPLWGLCLGRAPGGLEGLQMLFLPSCRRGHQAGTCEKRSSRADAGSGPPTTVLTCRSEREENT